MENKIQNGFYRLLLLIFPFALLNLFLIPFAHYEVSAKQVITYIVMFSFSFVMIFIFSKIIEMCCGKSLESGETTIGKWQLILSLAFFFFLYLANCLAIIGFICKKILTIINGGILQLPDIVILYDIVSTMIVLAVVFGYYKRQKEDLTSI